MNILRNDMVTTDWKDKIKGKGKTRFISNIIPKNKLQNDQRITCKE